MIATLSAPLTLDPSQATVLVLKHVRVEFAAQELFIYFALLDASGKVVAQRQIVANGAAVQTWIANQETNLYNALLNKLGLTGTVA